MLRLGVEDAGGAFDVLAELDGRYLSTEVAGGFTGRVIGDVRRRRHRRSSTGSTTSPSGTSGRARTEPEGLSLRRDRVRKGARLSHAETGEPVADLDRAPGDPTTPVTISYIAESAGVSVPTVSKVVNGRAGVGPDTRARVEALISQYGYRRPGPVKRSNVMELVFDELEHMWGMEIIRGVERVAREHRVGVVLTEFGPQRSAIRYWIDDALARRPACVVTVAQLSEEQRERLRAQGIPFVVFDPMAELPDGVPFVGATNWSGGRSAARHLIELGHRRIALVGGPDQVCAARRGWTATARRWSPPAYRWCPASSCARSSPGPAATRRRVSCSTARTDRPRSSPATTCRRSGCTRPRGRSGLRIPADLSVVGFDDLPVADLVDPPLTTVRQPLTEMADGRH